MPYAFALGARPFVDEVAIHQTAALEIAPLVRAYLGVTGSADGLVLFIRHLYMALVLFAGLSAYTGLRDIVAFAGVASADHPVKVLLDRLGYHAVEERENHRVLVRKD